MDAVGVREKNKKIVEKLDELMVDLKEEVERLKPEVQAYREYTQQIKLIEDVLKVFKKK